MIPTSFTSAATTLLSRLSARVHPVELIYSPHDHWPLSPNLSFNSLRISVLDSSFNPPTLAHLALALASHTSYDARLLLLSVRNADKAFKHGDATYLQRLEMMYLLAKDIDPLPHSNVAIAIIDEPTFIGKSTALLDFLRTRLASFPHLPTLPSPKLTFLLGTDTLQRVFSPRYYLPSHSEESMLSSLRHFFTEEQSTVVCARRHPSSYPVSTQPEAESQEHTITTDPTIPKTATEFILANQITFIDIGTEEQTYSSSQVRRERQHLSSNKSSGDETEVWKILVSRSVARYIEEMCVYLK